jgi:hypothetical protein
VVTIVISAMASHRHQAHAAGDFGATGHERVAVTVLR